MKRAYFLRRIGLGLAAACGVALLGAPAHAAPCCGPVSADGARLAAFLDQSGVEHLWLPGTYVLWRTGEPDPNRPDPAPRGDTHCSVFAAVMAMRLGVYLLRPPEHGQILLANAQAAWLAGPGADRGWRNVDAMTAQSLANQGELVVAVYANPDPHRPGHIAIIRPSTQSAESLQYYGPRETQAGLHNELDTSIAKGFAAHPGAWQPDGTGGIEFYAHNIDWADLPPQSGT